MHGPRLVGANGVELRPPTQDDAKRSAHWMTEPGPSRFWGSRSADLRDEKIEERYREGAKAEDQVLWSIAYEGEVVGFTGLFDIDWVARDGESGVFIGRADLYGRGIASEAVRLRTAFAWDELRLHRVHNWIALGNRGSRRANEKAGYRQIGLMPNVWFRSGEWHHGWLGEVFPPLEPPIEATEAIDGTAAISPPQVSSATEKGVSFSDKTLNCRDCGQDFVWTGGEQEFYQSRGLVNEPGRCPTCRSARRSSGGGPSAGGGRGLGGPREFFAATCSNCGGEARVPFQPRGDKPVYCSSCFEQVRPSASRGAGGGGPGH